MANGRMKFDQFEEEMNYIPKEFANLEREGKKKIQKMKKEFKEKIRTKVVNDKRKSYEFSCE